jgi:hypothetical protein
MLSGASSPAAFLGAVTYPSYVVGGNKYAPCQALMLWAPYALLMAV